MGNEKGLVRKSLARELVVSWFFIGIRQQYNINTISNTARRKHPLSATRIHTITRPKVSFPAHDYHLNFFFYDS